MKDREVHYFTGDGDYGVSKKLIRIVTTDWSDDDWNEVHDSPALKRWSVAVAIETKHKNKGLKS